MLRTRWYKVIADLWRNRARTLIVALAIAVGVYAVGTVASVRTLLLREYNSDQEQARVASIIIRTLPFDQELADRIAQFPEISSAEGRQSTKVRVFLTDNEPRDLVLVAAPNPQSMGVDRWFPVEGAWPPARREVILERFSPPFLETAIGKTLTVELDGGATREILVAGTAHDPQRFTPRVTDTAIGFVSTETMGWLGAGEQFSELHVLLADQNTDQINAQKIANRISAQIEDSGRPILSTTVLAESIVRPYVNTIVSLLTVLGIIILILSGFLVVNSISALITQQVQQIGVMKLVGARQRQIVAMYVVMVLSYGVLAVLIGIPPATLTARLLMTQLIEPLVNVRTNSYLIPAGIILIEIAIGLLIPLLAGLSPVLKGTRITTHRALNSMGISLGNQTEGLTERFTVWVQRAWSLRRPVVLAMRNALRHKGRLGQTLFVLVIGTALFISVLSVRTSVTRTLESFLRFHRYDVSVQFDRSYRIEELEREALQIEGVNASEGWAIVRGVRLRPDDTRSGTIRLYAMPLDTTFIDAAVLSGNWLNASDVNSVVINSDLLDDEADLSLGRNLVLEIEGKETVWTVIGVAPTDAEGPAVYVNLDDYGYQTRSAGTATNILVKGSKPDLESSLYGHFAEGGYKVESTETAEALNARHKLIFNIVVIVLILMALLLGAVGGLGLTTTMSINVLERVREIGVLRAIGASNLSVRQLIVSEGLAIGLLSWMAGTLLSLPVSAFMAEQIGLLLLNTPLSYAYSVPAAAGWFVILIAIAIVASLGPAQDAVRLTIREVLAYE